MPKVSSVLIETLKNHNVDRFYLRANGESYLPVMNELVSNPIIDVVTCRHDLEVLVLWQLLMQNHWQSWSCIC